LAGGIFWLDPRNARRGSAVNRVEEELLSESQLHAILALEDGRIFRGRAAGARTRRGGEVVFNTSLTGYQEVFTDPSYCGQIVCLTYPHIGNVGANLEDQESDRPQIEGLVVREFSSLASNWRSLQTAQAYLEHHGIPVLWDVDTRALVRHIRSVGALRGVLATDGSSPEALVAEARALPPMAGQELVSRVSCRETYVWSEGLPRSVELPATAAVDCPRLHVVAYDFGIKRNILRLLVDSGCRVTVVPARTSAEDVLALQPDGVFLSNGPGDPEPVEFAVQEIRRLLGRVPMFGICLGHQLLGLALGGRTFKLKFGHHGSNHPVKNLETGRIEITAQNHGFAVDPDSLPASEVVITHTNLNDGTNEGMRHRSLPVFSVQYHPEASPGPHDARYLFGRFVKLMCECRRS
jgi:carbamoyl-phosphate synthase small subunit